MSRRRPRQQVPKSLTYSKVDELMASPTQPLDESRRKHQLLRLYQGLRDLEESEKPSVEGWLVCSDVVNLTEALIEMGVAEDSTGLLRKAMLVPEFGRRII